VVDDKYVGVEVGVNDCDDVVDVVMRPLLLL
jgi:hypothetical protein